MGFSVRLHLFVAALVLVGATSAAAQQPQTPGEAVLSQVTLRGTVEAIDRTARTVRIRGQQGNVVTIDVPAAYTGFDRLQQGDVVTVNYYDRVSIKPHAAGEADVDRVAASQTPGLSGQTHTSERVTTATIQAWDPATRMVTFTTPSGASYTRRISETLAPDVIAGLKVGDRVDVTRTEAASVSVTTAAAGPQAAAAPSGPDTLRNRLTVSVLWGPDNSFSGEIAQAGAGTYQGTPISFVDTSFDNVYGRIALFKLGLGYRLSPRSEANFNFIFEDSSSEPVQIGTVGVLAAPMTAKFDDYKYWGIEAGQRFFFSHVRFTPYGGYTVGLLHHSQIGADFTAPEVSTPSSPGPVVTPPIIQPALNVTAGQFYDGSWAFTASGTGGVLVGFGPVEVLGELALRFTGGLADVPPLAEVGLGSINDDSSRWSIPILFGVRFRF